MMSGLPSWDLGEREREKKGTHAWSVFLAAAAAAVEEGRKEEVRLCMEMYLTYTAVQ